MLTDAVHLQRVCVCECAVLFVDPLLCVYVCVSVCECVVYVFVNYVCLMKEEPVQPAGQRWCAWKSEGERSIGQLRREQEQSGRERERERKREGVCVCVC